MHIYQKPKIRVSNLDEDELEVINLLLKHKENFFQKHETQIKNDIKNQNKIINNFKDEREKIDTFKGK